MRASNPIFLVIYSLLWTSTVNATEAIENCQNIKDPEHRLACYDRAVSKKQKRESSVKQAQPLSQSQHPPIQSLSANILSAKKRKRGEWELLLDNGQRWLQIDTDYIQLKAGQVVTIQAGAYAGYYLKVEGANRQVSVKRI